MAAYTEDRRFEKPWRVEEVAKAFVVRSANNVSIAYVYFEDEKSRADVMNVPNRKQALQIANRIAKIGGNSADA